MIRVTAVNQVYVKVHCDSQIAYELSDFFSYFAKDYQYNPKYRNRLWDGKIRLFNLRTRQLYRGLVDQLKLYAEQHGYPIDIDNQLLLANEFSLVEATDFAKSLNLPKAIELRDYQLQTLAECVRTNRKIIVSPTACHKKGDLVFTTDGWKKVEEIKKEDCVFGSDGKPKNIVRLFSGKSKMYDIIPKNNRQKITVTKDHILVLKHVDNKSKYGYCKGDKNRIEYITVDQYIKKSKYYKHCSVLVYNSTPLSIGDDPDTFLDPYFIGCYLGDGHVGNCGITTKDDEIKKIIEDTSKQIGGKIRVSKDGMSYFIAGSTNKRNSIFSEFEQFGLIFGRKKNRTLCEQKFIPNQFLSASIPFRFQLLAGLLDSDGYLANNTYFEFASKSQRLANNVQQLAVSLGLVSYVKEQHNKKYNKVYYKTIILGNVDSIPTRIPRKQATHYTRQRNPYGSSFEVIESKEEEYFGFEVEDNLYITHGGMITHNSGKSFVIYMLLRYYSAKTLIIVDNKNLLNQMASDFQEYGFDSDKFVHKIKSGVDKASSKPIFISTWQSAVKQPKQWFDQFDLVIGDEVDQYDAKSFKTIMENLTECKYRFGLTGTLEDGKVNQLLIEGLFGTITQVATTKQLIDQNFISPVSIKIIKLKHPSKMCRQQCRNTYMDEVDYLYSNSNRNRFICNLARSLKGNTLLLFLRVDSHGVPLYEALKDNKEKVPVYYVSGKVEDAKREQIRKIVNTHDNSITVASVGTFSRGVNIPRIDNIIVSCPSKSVKRVLQTIGRGLRKAANKKQCILYDIADDLRYGNWTNYTVKHCDERIVMYLKEQFPYKVYNVDLKE